MPSEDAANVEVTYEQVLAWMLKRVGPGYAFGICRGGCGTPVVERIDARVTAETACVGEYVNAEPNPRGPQDSTFLVCDDCKQIAEDACETADDCRCSVEECAEVSRIEELEEANRLLDNQWMEMYAGRPCPKCGHHVTMNVEGVQYNAEFNRVIAQMRDWFNNRTQADMGGPGEVQVIDVPNPVIGEARTPEEFKRMLLEAADELKAEEGPRSLSTEDMGSEDDGE